MNKLKTFLFCLILLVPFISHGAEISLSAEQNEYLVGEEFLVDVYIDTEGELINAIEGKLYFKQSELEVVSIKDGNSSINFWVTKPNIVSQGFVDFSGVTPGGVRGKDKYLFSAVFKPIKAGQTYVEVIEAKSLKNDGLGTRVKTDVNNLTVEIGLSDTALDGKMKFEDKREPETFLPTVGRDSEMYEGRSFVAFSTQDKQSGVDYYEVKEGIFGKYVRAVSPFVLNNQDLDNIIYVKAVDLNGNERVVSIKPENYRNWYKRTEILGIIVLVILVSLYNRKKWFNLGEE